MFLVGVAGGSGSGKTTFSKKVLSRLSGRQVAILHLDSYYLSSLPPELKTENGENFDHPDAFDWPLLKSHLSSLREGKAISIPTYDFDSSSRTERVEDIGPSKAIIVEGIFTLWNIEIRNLLDLKIYLHVDSDIRFIRRLNRDLGERGRSLDSVVRQYYDTVRPMYHEYLEPTQQYADLVIGEKTDVAAEVISAMVKEQVVLG